MRIRNQPVIRGVAAAAMLLMPLVASAWSAAGHRLVAELAFERLPASTKEKVQALLDLEPGATLESISTWADEVRSPSTASWHYVNFKRDAPCQYDADQLCPEGRCVVGAIERQVAVLGKATAPVERLKALKWVVHLIADVHQPLHAGLEGDKGGNLFQVQAFGRGTNLHAVWDGALINNWPGGLPALRNAVRTSADSFPPLSTPRDWAEESCRIATAEGFYPDSRFVSQSYQEQWSGMVAQRLAASVDRLVGTLRQSLP